MAITLTPEMISFLEEQKLTFKEYDRYYGCIGELFNKDGCVFSIYAETFYVIDKFFPFNEKTINFIKSIQNLDKGLISRDWNKINPEDNETYPDRYEKVFITIEEQGWELHGHKDGKDFREVIIGWFDSHGNRIISFSEGLNPQILDSGIFKAISWKPIDVAVDLD